ncbi:hypothetical protein BC834DRAFT_886350 [Gloeopeniophorella convolvens]|nr:hypothetical protein BC834DRAFT_886350 [Gloeopeniophorella convolvens]
MALARVRSQAQCAGHALHSYTESAPQSRATPRGTSAKEACSACLAQRRMLEVILIPRCALDVPPTSASHPSTYSDRLGHILTATDMVSVVLLSGRGKGHTLRCGTVCDSARAIAEERHAHEQTRQGDGVGTPFGFESGRSPQGLYSGGGTDDGHAVRLGHATHEKVRRVQRL